MTEQNKVSHIELADLPLWVQQDALRIRNRLPEGWQLTGGKPGENGSYMLVVTDRHDQPVVELPSVLLAS